MSEHLISSLNSLFKELFKFLKEFLTKILTALEPLKRLPELIENLGKKILEGFKDQIQAMGEMEIYIRLSQIRSKETLISEEENAIKELEEQLEKDLSEVRERYNKIQNGLNQVAHDRIRELDKHLLELYEKYFPLIFSNPFYDKIEPYYQEYFASTRDAFEERLNYLWDKVGQLIEILQTLIQTRQSYLKNFEAYLHPYKVNKLEQFLLPVMIIEYEDVDLANIVTEIHLPYYFEINKEVYSFRKIEPEIVTDPTFEPLLQYIDDDELIDSYLKWKKDEHIKTELFTKIENLIEKTNWPRSLLRGFQKNIQNSDLEILDKGE